MSHIKPKRILLTCCSIGRGHRNQSIIIQEMLAERGHTVMLLDDLPTFKLVVKDNKIVVSECSPPEIPFAKLFQLDNIFRSFQPDLIISDFDPIAPALARDKNLPYILVDPIRAYKHTYFPTGWKSPEELTYVNIFNQLTAALHPEKALKVIVPCITYATQPLPKNTVFVRPLIKRELLHQPQHSTKNHIVVYEYENYLEPKFKEWYPDTNFIYFGGGRPDRPDFNEILRSCAGVVCNGGLNLIAEALYLEKPLFCVPPEGHIEQQFNAAKVWNGGWGDWNTDPHLLKDDLGYFLREGLGIYNGTFMSDEDGFIPGNSSMIQHIERAMEDI